MVHIHIICILVRFGSVRRYLTNGTTQVTWRRNHNGSALVFFRIWWEGYGLVFFFFACVAQWSLISNGGRSVYGLIS